MPLLLCPNDNTAMQEIDRNGVKIDVCPQCRGVWLDRGELEKLLDMVGRDSSDAVQRADVPQRDQRDQRDQPRYDDRDRRHDGDRGYDTRKRKKRFELFDFFD